MSALRLWLAKLLLPRDHAIWKNWLVFEEKEEQR